MPGIANDIKKPGMEEHGYKKTPLKAAHSMFRATKAIVPDLPRITAPLLVFHSADDHVVDYSTIPHITSKVSSRDITERTLTDSYHVATLDNDAPSDLRRVPPVLHPRHLADPPLDEEVR